MKIVSRLHRLMGHECLTAPIDISTKKGVWFSIFKKHFPAENVNVQYWNSVTTSSWLASVAERMLKIGWVWQVTREDSTSQSKTIIYKRWDEFNS